MRPFLLSLAALAAAMTMAACGGEEAPAPTGADGQPLTRVRVQLNWFPEAEHGGFYTALINGHYEAEGLDVQILPGGVDVPVIAQVVTGRVEFGVVNADNVLQNRAQGANTVALMAPLQHSPRCLVVHADSRFEKIADIRDVTLAMSSGPPFSHFVKANAPLTNVRQVPYPGSVAPFLADPNFAMQGYVFSEPIVIRAQGADPRVLMVSEMGWDPYTSCLVASDEYVAANEEIVAAMTRASRRGWVEYLRDPEPTNRAINAANPQMTMEILTEGMGPLRELVYDDATTEENLGRMEAARWELLLEQMVGIEFIDAGAVEASQAFTTKFLE